jgi:hypothetical protein
MIEVILKRFETPDENDSWVLGDEPYVSLHFLGSEHYTK